MPFPTDPEAVDEAVYRALEAVPAGRVTSYGKVAALLGLTSPRRPAAAMTRAPDGLPWWRMVRSDGTLPAALRLRAEPHWDEEGTSHEGGRVRPCAFWQPDADDVAALMDRVGRLLPAPESPHA